MTEPRPSRVLGGLPRSRPHRRSQRRPALQPISEPGPAQPTAAAQSSQTAAIPEPKATTSAANPKRGATATAAKPSVATSAANAKTRATATAAKPSGATSAVKPNPRAATARPVPGARAVGTEVLGTAVQAAAELAEIGLTVGARTLRDALSRLPHS